MDKLRTLGSYQVLRLLSASPAHHVYKVKCNSLIYRLTAVPLFLSQRNHQGQIERIHQLLQKKCLKYKKLSHQNVEKIFDIFHFQNGPNHFLAFVGEYSTGGDLEDLIHEETTRNSPQLRQLMIDLCSGIQYLHSCSIIHCSITPENVRRIGGTYKICFPSFREVSWFNSRHQVPARAQTVYYLSPELHGQVFYNQSTDVWSIGVIFYELLSGRQFRLSSTQLPYEMGSFTEQMADVSNAMMRSLLKEMLAADSRARISISRVKNILSNTIDISLEAHEIEEDIVEDKKYHTLALPIFSLYEGEQTSIQDVSAHGQSSYFEVSLENFLITIIYKSSNSSLQFCVYCTEKDYSVMIEYHYQCLPSALLALFASAKEVFQQLKRETMGVNSINSFGELVLSLQEERYLLLKQAREKSPAKINILKHASCTISNIKDKQKHVGSEWDRYLDGAEEFETEQPQSQVTKSLYKMIDQEKRFYEGESDAEEKALYRLMDSGFDNFSLIRIKNQRISLWHMEQQNYSRCIECNEKVLNYYIRMNSGCYVVYPLSYLMACSEIFNDDIQVGKWQGLLRKDYSMYSIPCYLLAAVSLHNEYTMYQKNGRAQQSKAILQKVFVYAQEVIQEITISFGWEDDIIDHILSAVFTLLRNFCISLYSVGTTLLTLAYKNVKDSPLLKHKQTCTRIVKEISQIVRKAITLAPKLTETMKKWVKANMPERYSQMFAGAFY